MDTKETKNPDKALSKKSQLKDILYMIDDGWSIDEVANIILNCTKGNIDLDAYTGFNANELSKSTKYTK